MKLILAHIIFLTLSALAALAQSPLSAATWYLPQTFNDANVSIGFEVDTTWHLVHGKTSGIHGSAHLSEHSDVSAIDIVMNVPVAKFDTSNQDRDAELSNVMGADIYPEVSISGRRIALTCTPAKVIELGKCTDILKLEVKIKSVTAQVSVPVVIVKEGDRFIVTGEATLRWKEYGVEDPSIFLIARVDPEVKVSFRVILASAENILNNREGPQ